MLKHQTVEFFLKGMEGLLTQWEQDYWRELIFFCFNTKRYIKLWFLQNGENPQKVKWGFYIL